MLAVVSTLIVILLVSVIWTHGHRWHLGHDTVQLAILLAAAMSIAAVFSFEHGRFTQLSWWDYHAYLLAGFGAAVYAVLLRRHEQQTVTDLLDHHVRRRSVRAHRAGISRGAVAPSSAPSR